MDSDAKVIVGSKQRDRATVSQVAFPIIVSGANLIGEVKRRYSKTTFQVARVVTPGLLHE